MVLYHVLVLSAILLILALTLALTLGASQEEGFQRINCGGEAYNDPNTNIFWEADPFKNDNNGRTGKVNPSFKNITYVMKTLRFFPNHERNIKFCYPLKVLNGSTYLLRASIFYGNYDGLNQPPTFVLIFNYDEWTKVDTSTSTTPIIHELTFVSKGHDLSICLAPYFPSNNPPFISALELRPLNHGMYIEAGGALYNNFGLMLTHHINYGATTKTAIRYPEDAYDRIWEANTTGPIANISASKVDNSSYAADLEEPPAEVMATVITSKDSEGNLSFTYHGFGGLRIDMHFQELVENASDGSRVLGFAFPNSAIDVPNESIVYVPLPSPALIPEIPPLQITLFPVAGSPRGPLLNALELFTWTSRSLSTIATFQGDVVAIVQIQENFKLMGYGQGDPCMPKQHKWSWIACNADTPPRIIEINLASFNLTGDIPQSINKLTNLQKIDLSNNKLVGQIPDFNPLLELEYLNVSYNNLCGSLPSFKMSINFSYVGNTRLCSKCQCSSSNSTKKYMFAIFFLSALYIVSMLILLFIYKARHIRKKVENSTSAITTNKKGVDGPNSLPFATRIFTYNEIRNATLNFKTLLGEGGLGKVYHGILHTTGEAIAVKMLENASEQGLKDFYNEVAILSRVRHKNLVSLIGYCVENTYMLIYEYIAKGNIRNLLYGAVESLDKPLPWTTRLQIALDASEGLDYLHPRCDSTIIHGDVKSSNILLTNKMQAKVSDFGLYRLKEGDNAISHVSSINVAGTIGYLDPAYYATNQITIKSDVYNFGIVLFELICGRPPVDMLNSLPHIVDWATPPILQGKVGYIVDPMLKNGYKEDSMRKVVDVAFACVHHDRIKRPKMRQISQLLQRALEVEMQQDYSTHSQDIISESSTTNEEISNLKYIEILSTNLDH